MKLIHEGNQSAFCTLFNYYYPIVYSHIYRIVRIPIEAEDLTMESIEKAFKAIKFYKPTAKFSTWLIRIAKNHTFDFLNKRKIKFAGLENIDEICFENPETIYLRNERLRILETNIGKLRPEYKKVIELYYFEDYSYKELSGTLNVPVNSISVFMNRAKKQLKKLA